MYESVILLALLGSIVAFILTVRDQTCGTCGYRETTVRRERAGDARAVRYVYTCKHCQSTWVRPGGWRWFWKSRKTS